MKKWRGDFEGDLPAIPEASEQKQDHHGLTKGTDGGGYAGRQKDSAEKTMSLRVDAIEDDGHVGEEFGHYIKST